MVLELVGLSRPHAHHDRCRYGSIRGKTWRRGANMVNDKSHLANLSMYLGTGEFGHEIFLGAILAR